MSCKCQSCGIEYKVDILVDDDIWKKISTKRRLLCGKCIIDKLESLGYEHLHLTK